MHFHAHEVVVMDMVVVVMDMAVVAVIRIRRWDPRALMWCGRLGFFRQQAAAASNGNTSNDC